MNYPIFVYGAEGRLLGGARTVDEFSAIAEAHPDESVRAVTVDEDVYRRVFQVAVTRMYWITHNGRFVSLHKSLEGAKARVSLVKRWQETIPGTGGRRWKADTTIGALQGYEIREEEVLP